MNNITNTVPANSPALCARALGVRALDFSPIIVAPVEALGGEEGGVFSAASL